MKKITIVCGQYGSGKTEFCINFALHLRKEYGEKVSIADYDVINPYFRSREKVDFLKKYDIDILGNFTDNMTGTDLPALSSNIYGPLLRDEYLIIDLAGSHNGLKPLALIRDDIEGKYEFLCVLNAFRPETRDELGMIKTIKTLEDFGGMAITGVVHNSHLIHETTAGDVLYGQKIVEKVCGRLNIPLLYTQLKEDIYNSIKNEVIGRPIVFKTLAMRDEWM